MSEGSPGAGIENSIRSAYDRLPEIERKRKTGRYVKLLIPLVTLVILLAGMWKLWDTAENNVVNRGEELKTAFQQRMGQILPRIERQSRETVDRVLPRLQKEMRSAQAKASANLPDALEKHTKGMGERLEKRMNLRLSEDLARVGKQQRDKLANTFPEQLKCAPADTPQQCEKKEGELDRIMDEIQRSYQDWAIMEMRTTFDGHLKAMDDIRKTMSTFSKPKTGANGEAISGAIANPDAPAEMMMLFLELAAETMGGSQDFFEAEGETMDGKPAEGAGGK
jgi:hypothetical protein